MKVYVTLKTEVMTHYIFKYTKIEELFKVVILSQNCSFYCIYEQINLTLVTPKT